jgi:heme oxygenase (biliverdin-IX-beta and delta-forming)
MIMLRLRHHTAGCHARAERAVNLQTSLSSLNGYSKLIKRFYGFYAPLESALEHHTDKAVELLLSARRKTGVLQADLRALGVMTPDLAAIERCKTLPRIETVAHVVGCLYVLEGATLGGRVVVPALENQLGITAGNGGAFFASYADHVDIMWLSFGRAAATCCDTAEGQNQALDAALATFECFIRWFRSERLYPVPTAARFDSGLVSA